MKYISTRGKSPASSFEDVLVTGLAPDGGLYVPETLPQIDSETLAQWATLSYQELAFEIIRLFTDDTFSDEELREMINESYSSFADPAIAPLVHLKNNEWILELYHGPTLAFKDFALQLLGRLLDHVLKRRNQRVAILGATSGDTGSAALEGCRHSDHVDLFILHPHNRVSEVQRRQMTTVPGENVHNIAIEGNFDDCQKIVKQAFADQSFLPEGVSLAAVNSINWARIMAQIVYYFYAGLHFRDKFEKVSFSVPTGNFGDIYAGYLAKKMGLPIDRLIIATNRNDILHRFISRNQYSMEALHPTLSPSMDIMVSSNFERYLFELFNRDGERVEKFVTSLNEREQHVTDSEWEQARSVFDSFSVDDDLTCATIREVWEESEFLIDPHTATGVKAARECMTDDTVPVITLATAHPVKFAAAIEKAGLETPDLPLHMADLYQREERCEVLSNRLDVVEKFISSSYL